ncbi:MAG: 1-deoxy-D-xylulose-5-phosphate reductoisomerase [Fimbriimonadia bacterium]|nr:1-deoxy-D-xylulose-5-phosphate reductoisomerase [Fimbriimonadia bacterium]
MKRIAILGSTGSIGRQTLDVVRRLPDRLSVVALAANTNLGDLIDQAREFGVKALGILNPIQAHMNGHSIAGLTIKEGVEGLCDLVRNPEVDLVVVAVAGMIGLQPTLAALDAGKPVALATKETLVAGGEIVMERAKARGVPIFPIDSEHSAVFQCLRGERLSQVEKIILTASGGPFLNLPLPDLNNVTIQEALNHPNWRMGAKVSIDSATMMNKGLEVIEARWLFNLDYDQIEVAIHPQSLAHSIVALQDGSWLAQIGAHDMRIPIQYALTYPERLNTRLPRLSIKDMSMMTFFEPDFKRFPCLALAYEAARKGDTYPTVLNAANEVAVQMFLNGKIRFTEIAEMCRVVMREHRPQKVSLTTILQTDAWARQTVEEIVEFRRMEELTS